MKNNISKLARREVAKSVGRRYGNGDVSAAQRSRTVLATCSTASSDFIHGKCIAILLPWIRWNICAFLFNYDYNIKMKWSKTIHAQRISWGIHLRVSHSCIYREKGEFDSFSAMTIWPNIPREFDPLCDNET